MIGTSKRLLDAAIALRDVDKTGIDGGNMRLWVHPDTWKEFVDAIEGADRLEHGPITPSPMIDPEVMAEYRRSVEQFGGRKDVPR